MPIIEVSKGYQITIPAQVRKKFGFGIGSKLDLEIRDDKIVLEPLEPDWDKIFADVKKMPKHDYTPEELNKIAEKVIFD